MTWRRFYIGAVYGLLIFATLLVAAFFIFLLQSKIQVYEHSSTGLETSSDSFPVSVNINEKTIQENPRVDQFFEQSLALELEEQDSWWSRVVAIFQKEDWYQNMASPVSRIVVIWPGERKEEVGKNFADILGWNKEEKERFLNLVDTKEPILKDGKYLPDRYVTHKEVTPEEMADVVYNSFKNQVLNRYTDEVEELVPFNQALIIASLIEREASDFDNMREVSGVIWNRIFTDMPLQLDASLQYAKGSKPYVRSWWPVVNPNDKFINSPYNTYQNPGLPPAPIANPSVESIVAALNPIKTDCLFYFHTSNGGYYCSENYQEHVAKLKSIYGRGR